MKVTHKTRVVVQFLIPLALTYAALVSFFFVTVPWDLGVLAKSLAGAGVTAVALALLQDLIPKPLKEAIIFLRLRDRLPGHRCFQLKYDDPSRFDRSKIKNIVSLSNAAPSDQQMAFYKLYNKVSKKPSVEHYSIRYLAWRDMTAVSALLAIVTVPAFGLSLDGWMPAAKLASVMLLIGLISAFSARQAANELVLQVLALNSAR